MIRRRRSVGPRRYGLVGNPGVIPAGKKDEQMQEKLSQMYYTNRCVSSSLSPPSPRCWSATDTSRDEGRFRHPRSPGRTLMSGLGFARIVGLLTTSRGSFGALKRRDER